MQKAQPSTFVFVWGLGEGGTLGNAKKQNEIVPYLIKELNNHVCTKISTGTNFTVVVTAKGQLYGWGAGKYSRFGISEQLVEKPKKIPFNKVAQYVSAGNWHTMVIDASGEVYGVGHNKYGALGVGHFNEVHELTKSKIPACSSVAAGDGFSLFLTLESDLYSSGHNSFHGHKTKDNLHTPTKIKVEAKWKYISAGITHSACVTTNGEVYTWGQGSFYQLGHGNKNDEKEPKKVQGLKDVKIVNTSCTRGQKNAHTMAVAEDGTMYNWGAGYKGKLGHQKQWSHENQADEPVPRAMLTLKDVKWSKGIGGGIHSAALSTEGRLYTFGCGSDGRLGHIQSQEHVYLYRQGYPRELDTLKQYEVKEVSCSYYHNACIAVPRR